MKIAVFGANGFVGRHIIKELLLTTDCTIQALVHSSQPDFKKYFPELDPTHEARIEYSKGNALELEDCKKCCLNCDVIINAIGIIKETKHATFEDIHEKIVSNLVEVSKTYDIKRLISISALGTNANAVTQYFQTKWNAENIIRKSNSDFTILRPSIIWAESADFVKILDQLVAIPFITFLVGDGKTLFQPVHVEDLARICRLSIANPSTYKQTFGIGGSQVFSFDQLLTIREDRKNKTKKYIHLPATPMIKMIKFLEIFHLPLPVTSGQLMMLKQDNTTEDKSIWKLLKLQSRDIFN